ncbi:MAG: 3'(2'),5'-bisphosphate nucleotidase CysQ [Pseudolabrys sp.]
MTAPESATASALLKPLTEIVATAAAAVRAISASTAARRTKTDGSFVTEADERSEQIILDGLAALAPAIPVIAEEQMTRAAAPRLGGQYFLVDPLDGTREYVAGREEYAVNVALIRDGKPLIGIVASPARNRLWRGIVGLGAERLVLDDGRVSGAEAIRTRSWPEGRAIAVVSRSHLDRETEARLAALKPAERIAMGSALKFCLVAEGSADVYPRLGETSEWDVAAGHALIVAAGGAVVGIDGLSLIYGRAGGDFIVPGFIAWGDPARAP